MTIEQRAHDLVVRCMAKAAQQLEDQVNEDNDALGEINVCGSEGVEVGERAVIILRDLAKAHHDTFFRDEFAGHPIEPIAVRASEQAADSLSLARLSALSAKLHRQRG